MNKESLLKLRYIIVTTQCGRIQIEMYVFICLLELLGGGTQKSSALSLYIRKSFLYYMLRKDVPNVYFCVLLFIFFFFSAQNKGDKITPKLDRLVV